MNKGKKISSGKTRLYELLEQAGFTITRYATYKTGTGAAHYSIEAESPTHTVSVDYIKPAKGKNQVVTEVENALLNPQPIEQ